MRRQNSPTVQSQRVDAGHLHKAEIVSASIYPGINRVAGAPTGTLCRPLYIAGIEGENVVPGTARAVGAGVSTKKK